MMTKQIKEVENVENQVIEVKEERKVITIALPTKSEVKAGAKKVALAVGAAVGGAVLFALGSKAKQEHDEMKYIDAEWTEVIEESEDKVLEDESV